MADYAQKISDRYSLYSRKISEIVQEFELLTSSLGWMQAIIYSLQGLRQSLFSETGYHTLLSKSAQFPLVYRPETSDRDVFRQIFIEREYSCLDGMSSVDLVIDCGANVGYSSAYFLTSFPKCKVICVEPDPLNFVVLERNLAPYGDRVKLLNAGVWSHATGLKILETPYRDGREWAVQVRECLPEEHSEMQGMDIGTLLDESGSKEISILKMDIEGAEAVVFSRNYESWLPQVKNIVIELHDDSSFGRASDIVMSTVSAYKSFDVSSSGELTVFKTRSGSSIPSHR
jgi:FkbM family methyltransferase